MRIILKFVREPLVMFCAAAIFVFALHELTVPDRREVIDISPEALARAFDQRQAILGRPLNPKEQAGIIDQLIRQEILVREAIARNFHLHDFKTRARLVSQMHFVMAEEAPDPSAPDLAALHAEAPERYMTPKTVTFDHIFFATDEAAASLLMTGLAAGEQAPEAAGDRFWLGSRMERYCFEQINSVLGVEFAMSLTGLQPGSWAGPIRSARGWHLVRLESFQLPAPLSAEETNRRLHENWKKTFSARTFAQRLEEMKRGYRINIPLGDWAVFDPGTAVAEAPEQKSD